MSQSDEKVVKFGADRHHSDYDPQFAQPAAEVALHSLQADRVYQFAALTAGIFLLVTLL